MNSNALQHLTDSSLSLLYTLTSSHPTPFPPRPTRSPTPSPSLLLSQAIKLNAQLHLQLQQAHITATATRKAALAVPAPRGGGAQTEAKLRESIERARSKVQESKGRTAVRRGIVNALNHSYSINSHLSRSSTSTSSSAAQAQRDAETAALLAKRDQLALQLLNLQALTHAATQTRLAHRRRLLALNRRSSSLVLQLQRSNAQPEKKAIEGMTTTERKAWSRLQAELKRQEAGHAIIRNVFQLVVVESGVEWYAGGGASDEDDDPPSSDPELKLEAPMNTKRLGRLMLLAGDGDGDAVGRS